MNRQVGFASGWAQREARRIQKAITLLRPGIPGPGGVWADIGCGDGIFTSALYALIQPDGEITPLTEISSRSMRWRAILPKVIPMPRCIRCVPISHTS